MAVFADRQNLSITFTGQTVEFYVDGRKALTVDTTSVSLIDAIRDAADTFYTSHGL